MALSSLVATYRDRRVLVTGHTGFKGSWLSLWLDNLGAKPVGLALEPDTDPNHWNLLRLSMPSYIQDVRDAAGIQTLIQDIQPEIIFHLAAQPLVRRSYREPLSTWHTNVMGTANVLEACRGVSSLKAIVVVTSDKCYENQEWSRGYHEEDRLGGHDPYSASKAATELVVASYRKSFFYEPGSPLLASARAGNVIGGGDWSEDRLIPDLVRAVTTGQPLEIRYPQATRPWQHVLESLNGYLLLGQQLLAGQNTFSRAWNFGPEESSNRSVAEVLTLLQQHWPEMEWRSASGIQPHEASLLHLDSHQARGKLGWKPCWTLEQTMEKTAAWYRAYLEHNAVLSREQLQSYMAAMTQAAA